MPKHAYFNYFSDEVIEEKLSIPQNIPILEEIIARDIKLRSKLEKLPLKEGEIPRDSDLCSLLNEIKAFVDGFLGVSNIYAPKVSYRNIYDFISLFPQIYGVLNYNGFYVPTSRRISIKRMQRSRLITILAHEYAHHVQNHGAFYGRTFSEGQARSVQRYVSYLYAKKENNPAFALHNLLDFDLPELKAAYVWLCGKHAATPKESLFKMQTFKEKQYVYLVAKFKERDTKPSYHVRGNAFFSIREFFEGPHIHREIMARRYQIL